MESENQSRPSLYVYGLILTFKTRFRIIWTHQLICPSWTNGLYVHWFIIYIFQRFGLKVWNRVENTCKYRRLCNIGHMWGLSSLFFFCYSVWWIGSNFWTNLMDFRASLKQLLCKSVFNMWNIIFLMIICLILIVG
jgi:hypothetical protein